MKSLRVTVDDDLDLDRIINSGQCFRPAKTGERTFMFVTGQHRVTITDETPGKTGDKDPDSATVLSASCSQKEWDEVWHPYFDLDTNYRQIRKSIPKEDAYLTEAAASGAGIRILRQDRFETLISFIISQRKSIPAIRTAVERLTELFGEDGYFPRPENMLGADHEKLSSCGLGYRCPYISSAVSRIATGEVDLDELSDLSDEELVKELKSFAGVGDKVANCVALFAYHRTGRAPVDTWIARIINERYNGCDPFGQYGSVAGIMQQYMFYHAQSAKRV